MMKYKPNPVDTKSVDLPEGLKPLVEEMSKNVHEVWAATRISQGWTYGKERNDEKKKHPCLMPYEELSEEEKEYDRNTSIETIKLILKLGFKITRDSQYMK
ncbi:RyR domain-containing protein [Leyella stercorea]|uniref:RyR domain-containing protein n=1 Tax=Leyella stercorea TaxID=363265 RepID=UPI003A8EC6F9